MVRVRVRGRGRVKAGIGPRLADTLTITLGLALIRSLARSAPKNQVGLRSTMKVARTRFPG